VELVVGAKNGSC